MKNIMFTEAMFNAVIEGRKTQTRRLIKTKFSLCDVICPKIWISCIGSMNKDCRHKIKPRLKVGEKVYIKEPYGSLDGTPPFIYKYDGFAENNDIIHKWENKMFMPEKYARYFIEITDVRAERLQDISDEDCLKEGIETLCMSSMQLIQQGQLYRNYLSKEIFQDGLKPKKSYETLIDSINGKGTWDSNPYVFCYSFILIK